MNITVSGILSYPNLHRAKTLKGYENNSPKFRCSVLLKKGSEDLLKIEQVIERVKLDKWDGSPPHNYDSKCLVDLLEDPVTKGYVALKALSDESSPPRVVDQNGEEILSQLDYVAGQKCMMSVSIYAFSSKGNGISAGINGVKILKGMGELGRLGRTQLSDDEMFGETNKFSAKEEEPRLILTMKAGVTTLQQFADAGWDHKDLIDQGYAVRE